MTMTVAVKERMRRIHLISSPFPTRYSTHRPAETRNVALRDEFFLRGTDPSKIHLTFLGLPASHMHGLLA